MSSTFSTIDAARLAFREPTKIEHGVLLSTTDPFRDTSFQLPPMQVKFDPSPSDNGTIKIATAVTDPALTEWLNAVDARVVQQLVLNSQEWFKSNKPLTEAVAMDKYSGILNTKNPKYDPLMKMKLSDKSKHKPTEVFRLREDGKSVEECAIGDVRRGDTVTAIVRLTGLFVGSTGTVFPQISVDEMLVEGGGGDDAKAYAHVDPTHFQYTDPKKLEKGGEVVFVQGRAPFTLPENSLVKFTPHEPENEGQGKKVAIELSDGAFARWVQALDAHNIDTLVANSEAWFGAPVSREVVESRYTPLYRKKDAYAPLLYVRLRPIGKGSPTRICALDPDTDERVPADDSTIRQGVGVTVTANLMGMYIINKNVYPTLNAEEVVVHPAHGSGPDATVPAYADVDPACFQYTDLTQREGIGMTFARGHSSFTLPHKMLLKFAPREPERKGQPKRISLEVADDELAKWLKCVDAHNVDMIVANGEKWFGRPISRDIAESRYNPLFRQKDSYAPLLGLRVMGADRRAPTTLSMVHEDGDEEIPCDELALDQGVRVSATVKYVGMCLINKSNFYPMLNAEKLVIHPNTNKLKRKFNFEERGLTVVKPESMTAVTPLSSAIPAATE